MTEHLTRRIASVQFDSETYIVNVRTGTVHVAYGGRTMERCNVDQIAKRATVDSVEDVGGVTKRTPRFCQWCARDLVR